MPGRFPSSLGRSAGDLLSDIRMTVAANALETSDMSTGAVATLAGYQSEAPFQRAFKHQMGITPAQWRRTHARSTASTPLQRDGNPGQKYRLSQ